MAAFKINDRRQRLSQRCSDIQESLHSFRKCLSDVSESCHPSLKPDIEDKLSEIHAWVTEQKKNSKETQKGFSVEDVGKVRQVLQVTVKSIEKFKSEEPLDITSGVLDIISTIGSVFGGPFGPIVSAICGIIGTILSYNKPKQPSVVDQLAKNVHKELVNFNKKLQDQKYDGLKRRVSDQTAQLRMMKPGEKLDDPNLWNDYVQFMGELSNRLQSPLQFNYDKESLTKDPDVADFVTAVVTYCRAYCCFMALLLAAKGKFADLGSEYKDNEDAVDRKISCQRDDTKEKLSFLSEEKYLTFLGSLPYEGGKLTKIVVLSRNPSGKRMVEEVRSSLSLPKMPDLANVESAASKVSRQSVKLKLEGHEEHRGDFFTRAILFAISLHFNTPQAFVQFINETDFPTKIFSGTVSGCDDSLKFVQGVWPRSSYRRALHSHRYDPFSLFIIPSSSSATTGGYLVMYLNGIMGNDVDAPTRDVRVIEFALSDLIVNLVGMIPISRKIDIQDKTSGEFTRGEDTYKALKSDKAKTLYWFYRGMHYMVKAEIVNGTVMEKAIWRIIVQDFDPFAVQD